MVPGQAPLLASLPSSFLLCLSLSCPPFSSGDPLDPVEAHSVHPTCEGSARTPARINQPVNVRIFVPVPPSLLSVSLSCLLVPYSWKIGSIQCASLPPRSGLLRALTGQFYALLLRLLHENAASSKHLLRYGWRPQ